MQPHGAHDNGRPLGVARKGRQATPGIQVDDRRVVDPPKPFTPAALHGPFENIPAQSSMGARPRVVKRVPMAQLLKATDIMQKSAQPRKVYVARLKALSSGYRIAGVGNPVRMLYLERNALVIQIELGNIRAERALCICPRKRRARLAVTHFTHLCRSPPAPPDAFKPQISASVVQCRKLFTALYHGGLEVIGL